MSQQVKNESKTSIGFFGGTNVIPSGITEDFLFFFKNIKNFADWNNEEDKNLIIDRLYKRYVKEKDIDKTSQIMNSIKRQFKDITYSTQTLYDESECIFSAYEKCLEYTQHVLHKYRKYIPLRIVVAELPHCAIDTERSLEKLDTWDGPPFWTRFYLKELYDQGKEIPELPF